LGQHGAEKKHDVLYTDDDKGYKLVWYVVDFFKMADENRNFYRVAKVEKLPHV
jgi:hypothetical protein